MQILKTQHFNVIDNSDKLLLKELNPTLEALSIRYAGMGYYYIFFENTTLHSIENRYVILLLGGSNGYDRENLETNLKNYNGPFYTMEDCIRHCKNLIES